MINPKKISRALGICLGASTISLVQLQRDDCQSEAATDHPNRTIRVVHHELHVHGGNPKKVLQTVVDSMGMDDFDTIAVTGRKFQKFINLSTVSEPEAVEYAYHFTKPPGVECPAVVSAGGETFMVYVLNSEGKIANVLTGNKCASGTGEFFLQQLRRMDVALSEIGDWADWETPYHVSGRCSVFCKSDCTHATNKGIPKSKVTAGLCVMMANKVLELLKKVQRRQIMITGGTAMNQMMIENLRREIPDLIVPEEAPYFEALGAALWALENPTRPFPGIASLFRTEMQPFAALPALQDCQNLVTFKTLTRGTVFPKDRCLLGLDVGSTTTKAVLLRESDHALLASVYLRTNGDPVGAARLCYRSIRDQIAERFDPGLVDIIGLGVCGSGRQIAGLHALTDGVINEIIAHATAAVYFDPKVDTIFEIGGQDAKYTYIVNSVPADYAMNEACSAGTGSFLEESALESLNVAMEDIAGIAMQATRPPNFNDQCAAFIASDIKNAIHEGIAHEDIIAGLVYSICMNYSNRVKGNRPVGEKVFMQGGVCYNQAVPMAMAALVGKPIVVPPEPGLMGAFGVALEVEKRIRSGLMAEQRFDLHTLINREVEYGKSFTCRGGGDNCDRGCKIAMIHLEGKRYPFGGACNRYYNLRLHIQHDVQQFDLVKLRNHLVFSKYAGKPEPTLRGGPRPRVGINRSFLVSTFFPLYSTFFAEIGFEPVMPETPSQAGIDMRESAFCYPAELSHGFFHSLISGDDPPDYIFLPHLKAIPSQNGKEVSLTCPFVQGETFFLQSTFRKFLAELAARGKKVLSPLLDLSAGLEAAGPALIDMAGNLGVRKKDAEKAFAKALQAQRACEAEMRAMGRKALEEIEKQPDRMAAVIFSRSYNGLVDEANMGIPHKIASRGVTVIPADFLSFEDTETRRHMYWGTGQRLLKAAAVVKQHPQLFGVYITNFSCGPDSFIITYFRDLMERKPSLTLELDSHTADAGLETRIEAFLDIVSAYRKLVARREIQTLQQPFSPARTLMEDGSFQVQTSSGRRLSLNDPKVTVLFPSMGRLASEAIAAVFRSRGFNAVVHPPADEAVLKLGRANTSCKECLPLILTTGTLLNYAEKWKQQDEVLVYFMPTGSGPCRFGQYYVYMEDLIRRLGLPDVTLFSLTSENGYAGMGNQVQLRAWWGVIVSDVMEDIRSMLLADAVNPREAEICFETEWRSVLDCLEKGDFRFLEDRLKLTAARFREIPMKQPPETVPTIFMAGEIFVRRDAISRQYLTEKLAEKGFATVCAPIGEWLLYSDYLVDRNLTVKSMNFKERMAFAIRKRLMGHYEKRIKKILGGSGLVQMHAIDIRRVIRNAAPFISENLTGEAVLTVGTSLAEIATQACGVIAIGPFGCMPNRISESILNDAMNSDTKLAIEPRNSALRRILDSVEELPFLAIESDGSPFPQLINAKLEAFCLRAERLHHLMKTHQN
ncbi:MAG: acyl-CoA dehydratase activase [Thermodesulfobacteriota bacterium]